MGPLMGGATSADIVSRGLAHVDALVLEDPALFTMKIGEIPNVWRASGEVVQSRDR